MRTGVWIVVGECLWHEIVEDEIERLTDEFIADNGDEYNEAELKEYVAAEISDECYVDFKEDGEFEFYWRGIEVVVGAPFEDGEGRVIFSWKAESDLDGVEDYWGWGDINYSDGNRMSGKLHVHDGESASFSLVPDDDRDED